MPTFDEIWNNAMPYTKATEDRATAEKWFKIGHLRATKSPTPLGQTELALLNAIAAIRKSDCGAWMKDCTTGLFKCGAGAEKRMELGRLLNKLYKAAGI